MRAPINDRVVAGVLAAASLAVLVVASWLTPSNAGHGTHTQLGLPACGWFLSTGKPCPTCGMTTAFASMATLDVTGAFKAQPMGAIMALGTAIGFWGFLHVAVFGSRLGSIGARLLRPRVMWLVGAIALGSWAYKFATMSPV